MKRIWSSPCFAYLLLLPVLGLAGYAGFTLESLPPKLGAGALAAYCLVCFLDAERPASPVASKLRKFLNVAGSGLMWAAVILVLVQYLVISR